MIRTISISIAGALALCILWYLMGVYSPYFHFMLVPWWIAVYGCARLCAGTGAKGYERRGAGFLFLFFLITVIMMSEEMELLQYVAALLPVPFLITSAANREKKRHGL